MGRQEYGNIILLTKTLHTPPYHTSRLRVQSRCRFIQNNIAGWFIIARAISHLLFCPPDSLRYCLSSNGPISRVSQTMSRFRLIMPESFSYKYALLSRFCLTVNNESKVLCWNTTPSCRLIALLFLPSSCPQISTLPESGG